MAANNNNNINEDAALALSLALAWAAEEEEDEAWPAPTPSWCLPWRDVELLNEIRAEIWRVEKAKIRRESWENDKLSEAEAEDVAAWLERMDALDGMSAPPSDWWDRHAHDGVDGEGEWA